MAAEIGIASGKSSLILGVSSSGVKIGAKGGTERGHQAAGHAMDPSGVLVVALPSFLGVSGGFRDADFLYNFPEFLEHF